LTPGIAALFDVAVMASSLSGCELASQLVQLLESAGIAGIAGGSVCLLRYRDGRRRAVVLFVSYIGLCALAGFNGALLGFLLQVGMTSGAGLAGMLDLEMARLLLGFEVGSATLLRLAGFLIPTLACAWFASQLGERPPSRFRYHALGAAHGFALLLLLASFAVAGHVAVLGPVAKAAIALQVLAAATWVGAFVPLLHLCLHGEGPVTARLMKRFGDMARHCLFALFVAGLVLVFELFHSPGELFSTAYGLALLGKLALVAALLALAACNRFAFVPRMARSGGGGRLAWGIRAEIVVAALILAVTGYLATVVGPPAMPM